MLGKSDLCLCLAADAVKSDVLPAPRNIHEFAGRLDEDEWWEAARAEYKGKIANKTFDLVPRPDGVLVCKTGIKCSNKLKADGTLDKRKVRWYLCGYSQVPGLHFDKTYTATAKGCSVKCFFAIVAICDLDLCGADVKLAFTHADLDVELYCEQMPGFIVHGKDGKPLVCKLRKALEGGKQSGMLWQKMHTDFLLGFGFEQCRYEPCLFTLRCDDGFMIILVWIDDLAIGYKGEKLRTSFFTAYCKAFNAKEIETLDLFLGMAITRDRSQRTITLSQEKYIEKLADKFLSSATVRKTVSTPAWFLDRAQKRTTTYTELQLSTGAHDDAINHGKPYLELIGSILYANLMTRSDITFHTSYLCRFMHRPSLDCYARAEELLNYLHSSKHMTLTLGGPDIVSPPVEVAKAKSTIAERIRQNYGMHIFSDASWKVNSTYISHAILFSNAAVDVSTRLLKVTASSSEAEIGAGCLAAKRHTFCRNVINTMLTCVGVAIITGATPHFIDNSAAIEITENVGVSKKTEHFLRWMYYLREAVLSGWIKTIFVNTREQVADGLTKVVDKATFFKMRHYLLGAYATWRTSA